LGRGRQRGALPDHKAHFASYSGTAPLEASSGELVHHRLSLAGNRKLNRAPCIWSQCARPGRTLGAEPTTARRSRRASLVRRRCGASRGASPTLSSGASWQICKNLLAAPLDKEEPRTSRRSSQKTPATPSVNRSLRKGLAPEACYGVLVSPSLVEVDRGKYAMHPTDIGSSRIICYLRLYPRTSL
jgi:hypothetical protein